jgi:hypothetical protein
MRPYQNYLLFALTLIAVGLSALAWKQHQELIELRATTLGSGGRADWQKRTWTAEKRAKDLESRLAAARRNGPAAAASPAAASGPTPGSAINSMVTGFTSLLDRPEAARLMALQHKAQVDARYAALFRKLALSPDKLAQLKSLLADKLSTPIDVLAAAGQQGIDPVRNPQEFRQLNQNAQTELEEKIKALLEPASYAQYQTYLRTEPQRAVVSQLQQALSYTDSPLTAAQADQLAQILADTAASSGGTPSAGGSADVAFFNRPTTGANVTVAFGPFPPDGGGGLGGSLINNDAIARAQGLLSTSQVQALQDIQQQQQAAAQLRQLMFQNAGGRGPVFIPPVGGPASMPGSPPGG